MFNLICSFMNKLPRSQTNEYYIKSGEIYLGEIGYLGTHSNCSPWPDPKGKLKQHTNDEQGNIAYGRWYCDSNGITRDGDWCKLSDLSRISHPEIYEEIEHYLLKY